VAQSRLRFGIARCWGHPDVAFPRGVMLSHGSCPPSRRRPKGIAGGAEVVDVGRHWVVLEAGLCDRIAQNNSILSPKPVHMDIKK
jgi:hypothetical protein